MKFGKQGSMLVCTIGGEWGYMCKARNLVVGQSLKLAVAHASDNRIIYLRHVPGQRNQTHLLNPMAKVISKKSGEALYCASGASGSFLSCPCIYMCHIPHF